MQSFEFLFNPNSPYAVYDTFCFEPENEKEKKLGNLYIAGELKNSLPQKRHFLSSLANIIKKEYYGNYNTSPEESFKKSLEKANEFLSSQIKNNEVDWLGNLNFAVLAVTPDCLLHFTTVGKLKIFLLRNNEILNIEQRTKLEEERVSSSKIFQNIITGSLNQENKILITTEEISDLFKKEGILKNLAQAKEKEIKKIFKTKRRLLENVFGFCLLISLTPRRKELRISFSKIRFPFLSRLIPELSKERLRKSLISILILAILLLLGSFLFK